jgi:hypothetical protein
MPEKKELDIGISKFAREKVIEHLKYSFTHDHLEEVDFEKRCNIAINTRDRNDLKALVEDLPEYKEEQATQTNVPADININTGKVKDHGTLVSILSGAERKGMWKVPKKLNLVAILGGTDLDFSQAIFPPGVTEINVLCFMGGIDIKVPQGVNVDNQCIALMGGVDNKCIETGESNGPTLRITGFIFMGGLDIKNPKEGLMKRILKKLGIEETTGKKK